MSKDYDTLGYYDKNASKYCDQTINTDMSEAYGRFISFLPNEAYILDFGCGSGRDSKYFLSKGYKVTAIDGSSEMCKLASDYIGQEVKCMDFSELSDKSLYDGIWACSSIVHVEKDELPYILRKMVAALKVGGIIYTCFKYGSDFEIKEGKYYNYMTPEEFIGVLKEFVPNAELIDSYSNETYTGTVGKRSSKWINFLVKRIK